MVTRMLRGSAAVGLAVGIWWAIVATTRSVPLEETPPPPLPVASADVDDLVPLEEFAPAFLGMFRKAMLIENESRTYAEKYDVDIDLVHAVLIQESGGNANLTSIAGAGGYFQVMPATFRSLRVETNIEAGVKYLGQMIRQFRREDYAVAAYNGGPGRARRGRPPLETLQYVLSVGAYRSVLKMHEPSVRAHAEQIELEPIREGDNWWTLSQRTGVSILQLRMHNPFLATRALRVGQFIAYPTEPRTDLFTPVGDDLEYRARLGDNYLHLAFVMEIDRDALREMNDLWHLQTVPPGQVLRFPLEWTGKHNVHTVQAGEDLETVAKKLKSAPWRIIRDNSLFWDEQLSSGMVLRVRPAPPRPTYLTYRVQSGDTLAALARRYGTNVRAIQAANNMNGRTLIRIGQRLRIPTRPSE